MQHIKALVSPVPRQHVTEHERLGVTHVQVARGVREHVEHVLAWEVVTTLAGGKEVKLGPHRSPLRLNAREVVTFVVV